jgi:hypothetical protein
VWPHVDRSRSLSGRRLPCVHRDQGEARASGINLGIDAYSQRVHAPSSGSKSVVVELLSAGYLVV